VGGEGAADVGVFSGGEESAQTGGVQCVAVCCGVMQCVVVCYGVVWCVVMCCSVGLFSVGEASA